MKAIFKHLYTTQNHIGGIDQLPNFLFSQGGICNSSTGSLLDLSGKGIGSLCDMFLGKTLQSH